MTHDRVDEPRDAYVNEPKRVMAATPPSDGMLWENQCARCGSSLTDLNRYCEPTNEWFCLSSAEWCEANPLPGREHVPTGTPEWYQVAEL